MSCDSDGVSLPALQFLRLWRVTGWIRLSNMGFGEGFEGVDWVLKCRCGVRDR